MLFQLVVLQQLPDDTLGMAFGLLIVAVGVALFLQGLELSIFPVGKSLSNQFARKGSIPILLAFGFAMGFSAVVTLFAPEEIVGLATNIEGRSVLIDGFGLIAFASIFPIVTVMLYAIIMQWQADRRKEHS